MMGRTLGHFVRQTWRSIVSFFMSFVVLGIMVWFTPEWVKAYDIDAERAARRAEVAR